MYQSGATTSLNKLTRCVHDDRALDAVGRSAAQRAGACVQHAPVARHDDRGTGRPSRWFHPAGFAVRRLAPGAERQRGELLAEDQGSPVVISSWPSWPAQRPEL